MQSCNQDIPLYILHVCVNIQAFVTKQCSPSYAQHNAVDCLTFHDFDRFEKRNTTIKDGTNKGLLTNVWTRAMDTRCILPFLSLRDWGYALRDERCLTLHSKNDL